MSPTMVGRSWTTSIDFSTQHRHNTLIIIHNPYSLETNMKLTAAILLLASSSASGEATYEPGNFSDGNKIEHPVTGGVMYLANGLQAVAVGSSGEKVALADGTESALPYHANCDGGAAIPTADGGHIYVSNSEIGSYPDELTGGVYALTFDEQNKLTNYQQLLSGTAYNCHGGETPWGTWISCEEFRDNGRCWQVDPTGQKAPARTAVTGQSMDGSSADEHFGAWEAFAWDADDNKGYVTNDDYPDKDVSSTYPDHESHSYQGAIVRFSPDETALACLDAEDVADKWCVLESGTVDYLKLTPSESGTGGTFEWVADKNEANPDLYAGTEGAHVEDGKLTFSTIRDRYLMQLDLAAMTYTQSAVPFWSEPDNLRILDGVVYVCTDNDDIAGDAVWRWDDVGASRMFYEVGHSYPAGVDFADDNMIMYVSMYGDATYQITRTDGLSFADEPKSITYEVNGGIAEGKTHEEIADEVNKVKASVEEMAPEEEAAAPASGGSTPAAAPAPAVSGAASNVAAGTLVGIITGTLML
ncbi:hypothetical protein ACHAW5_009835 [Stephanodiscus triporus]|uniref:Alkaline phosphatase n=1 Tax=Stephanodiscus triporus TaxID=2934178 RepID=A0ABD3NF72_9STRA